MTTAFVVLLNTHEVICVIQSFAQPPSPFVRAAILKDPCHLRVPLAKTANRKVLMFTSSNLASVFLQGTLIYKVCLA